MPTDHADHIRTIASNAPLRIRYYTGLFAVIWTVAVMLSYFWNIYQSQQAIEGAAMIQARNSIIKDVIYRRWNAQHGGVFVPVTDETQPNPYLKVPQREIQAPSGTWLTLMNPAYMTRQVHELGVKTQGFKGHITSLKPIRPANAPDPWEAEALQAFETGATEVSSLESMDGNPYFRLMRPLVTEPVCLKCHAEQGYQVGDIRGGISASVPMTPLLDIGAQRNFALLLGHGLLWLIGMAGLFWSSQRLSTQVLKRARVELEREKLIGKLQTALESIKTLRGLFPICANCKKIRDDQGYWNQIEGYLREHSEAEFSHSICPDCVKELYPDFDVDK